MSGYGHGVSGGDVRRYEGSVGLGCKGSLLWGVRRGLSGKRRICGISERGCGMLEGGVWCQDGTGGESGGDWWGVRRGLVGC